MTVGRRGGSPFKRLVTPIGVGEERTRLVRRSFDVPPCGPATFALA